MKLINFIYISLTPCQLYYVTADISAMNSKLNRLISKYKYSKDVINDPFYTTDLKGISRENQQKAQQKFNNWISSWQLQSPKAGKDFKKVASLKNLGDYGCWCNFQTESSWSPSSINGLAIKHKAVNQVDNLCKQLHNNYDCLNLQGCKSNSYGHISQMSYILDDQGLAAETYSEISYACNHLTVNKCQKDLCISESTFIANLVQMYLTKIPINKDYRHAMFGFNLKRECSVAKQSTSEKKIKDSLEKSIFKMSRDSPVDGTSLDLELDVELDTQELLREEHILDKEIKLIESNKQFKDIGKKSFKNENQNKKSEEEMYHDFLTENFTCCGNYPESYPYKNDGIKECCKDQLYSAISQCCVVDSGFIAPIGTC